MESVEFGHYYLCRKVDKSLSRCRAVRKADAIGFIVVDLVDDGKQLVVQSSTLLEMPDALFSHPVLAVQCRLATSRLSKTKVC